MQTILTQMSQMSSTGLVAVYCTAIGVCGLTLFLVVRTVVRHAAIIVRGWPPQPYEFEDEDCCQPGDRRPPKVTVT